MHYPISDILICDHSVLITKMQNMLVLVGLVAASLGASMAIAPVLASVLADYLQLESANVETSEDGLDAELTTGADIPQGDDAVGSAFGYGLLTDQGTDAVIVTTTHSGVLDSETQNGDANDPIWHNHYVRLGPVAQCEGLSANSTGVIDITFEQPGDVEVDGQTADFTEMPNSFNGTNALTNASMSSSPGNNVQNAVSFNLVPVFDGEALQAACVNDISAFNATVGATADDGSDNGDNGDEDN
jgi:hypothetical protein